MNPFDFVNSITFDKNQLMVDDETEKAYNAFLVNRQLSYFQDTVLLANEMNKSSLPNKMQYDFLINTVRKRKRFTKWFKPEQQDDVEAVKHYYGYSDFKARQAITLLSPEQLQTIRNKVSKGGRK